MFDTTVRVRREFIFVTGTDTGVGKTVFTALLIQALRRANLPAAALKPLCSGGRGDARQLRAAQRNGLALDEINPWYFRAPLAPMIAARRAGRRVTLRQVTAHARRIQRRFPLVMIEGAGGLLSPMGEDFDSRDLIAALRALPIVVASNRLGTINQVLLVLAALPMPAARKARIVLFGSQKPDPAAAGNLQILRERFGSDRVFALPWLDQARDVAEALAQEGVGDVIGKLKASLQL